MKRIIGLIIFLLMVLNANAQKLTIEQVPSAIKNDLQIKFPAVEKIKWKKIESLYFAQFKENGMGIDVTYQSDGIWIETLTEIKMEELPTNIVLGINYMYTNAHIKAAAKVEQSSKQTLYIIQLRHKSKKIELTLDSNGKATS